jgi:prevent-host-death family protein
MARIASRELRNQSSAVLRRVAAGEEVVITVRGEAVAQLVPVVTSRRRWLPRADLVRRLAAAQADAGLREDLQRIAGDDTGDLGDIQ